jgi:hypothetical protein
MYFPGEKGRVNGEKTERNADFFQKSRGMVTRAAVIGPVNTAGSY